MNMDEGELSDQFLIDAIAGKGMWALERLYDRYGKRFYALAYRMTADHMAAEELVQDAFLAIWQSAKLYVPQASPVRKRSNGQSSNLRILGDGHTQRSPGAVTYRSAPSKLAYAWEY